MNHELAKTLTTALVQFIDRERPEGTMDCSSYECEKIEKAFEGGTYDVVENLIQRKLTGLATEFEQEVSDIVEYCKEHGENVAFDYAKRHAKTLLDLAKKEMPLPEDTVIFQKGVEEGRRLEREEIRLKFYGNTEPVPTVNGPLCLRYGGICSNPMRDCINCNTVGPVKFKFNTNTSSGTSTLKAEG